MSYDPSRIDPQQVHDRLRSALREHDYEDELRWLGPFLGQLTHLSRQVSRLDEQALARRVRQVIEDASPPTVGGDTPHDLVVRRDRATDIAVGVLLDVRRRAFTD